MKTFTRYWRLAAEVFCLFLLSATSVLAYDYQRYITFQNDFNFSIYPVIQVPADICDGAQFTNVRRIIVNGQGHDGLSPNEKVTVFIPNEEVTDASQQVQHCWYRSGRVYIFPVDIANFEAAMVSLDPNNKDQTTQYNDTKHPSVNVTCFEGSLGDYSTGADGNCFTGVAKTTFAGDAPAQLAEYTFDSDNPNLNNDADSGIPMADIDVSNVDDLYLPLAASVSNNGATGYMGGATDLTTFMDLTTFKQRVDNFYEAINPTTQVSQWPVYAAYMETNWLNNAFSNLMPSDLGGASGSGIVAHLPAGYNIINNTLGRPLSTVYKLSDNTPENYMISGVAYNPLTGPSNPQVQPYIDRWMAWVDNDPCTATKINKLIWPDNITSTFNKQNFCEKFRTTVRDVWKHFLSDPADGFTDNKTRFYSDCGLSNVSNPDKNLQNACIIQHIVGYNSQVLGGTLPGEVQALLRSVAYDPTDPLTNPKSQQYQFDPFLTFAAPYGSQFNLDPYTRLIHSEKDGVGAVAYSFSIDDKYGNFRDASSGFIVDAGGTSALENKRPYDPYQQYKMSWSYNRDKFSLAWLEPGINLTDIQAQLQDIAVKHQNNQPFLIRQGDNLSVLGHTTGTGWKLTNPLVTLKYLQQLAAQEKLDSKGKTHYVQDLIDHVFGDSSIFPNVALDVNNVSKNAIGVLDFDIGTNWAGGEAKLYDFISQQNADVPSLNNWVSATVCGVGIPINGPGSQTLPLPFANGAYQPCPIVLTDGQGEELALNMTPVEKSVTDNYTGATVNVWGFPVGNKPSGNPLVTSDLSANDLQYCQGNSAPYLSQSGFCSNVNVSAVWSGDPLARDIVYMGLNYVDMPRVQLNLPAAPPTGPDPNAVFWPNGATLVGTLQADGVTVHVTWPAAVMYPIIKPLNYSLTFGGQFQASCNTQQNPPINPNTYCDVQLPKNPSHPIVMDVVAINYTASPQTQSAVLTGNFSP